MANREESNPNKRYQVDLEMPPLPEIAEESELNLFDPQNPDLSLFNLVDEELIRLSGSKLLYHKYHSSRGTYDEVYLEEREKAISSEPITVVGHYNPTAIEENLSQFGIELTNDQLFVFNKSYIEQMLHRTPQPHDIIRPKFQNIYYEVFEVQEEEFAIYGVYHLVVSARVLRDSDRVTKGPITNISDEVSQRDLNPKITSQDSPMDTNEDLSNPYGDS